MPTPLHSKYTMLTCMLSNSLVKITQNRSEEVYFGEFNNFNAHINVGLFLKNVLCLKSGKTYPSCIVGDVEVRNTFAHADFTQEVLIEDDTHIVFNSYGVTTTWEGPEGDKSQVKTKELIGWLRIELAGTAYKATK